MSENDVILSKRSLIIIGITFLAILIVGMILLGLGYNEAFFAESSTIRAIFEVITFTGESIFFIVLIAIFYIAYDKRFAKNLAFSLLFSVYLNEMIKEIVQDPRPATNVDPAEDYGFVEPGYGFPSGHSQNAVATWGYMAQEFKNKTDPPNIIPILLSVLIFLIAISRIIVGVHDLQDIIGGLLIGICFLLAYLYFLPIISPKIESLDLKIKIGLVIITSLALFLVGILLFPTAGLGLVQNPQPYTDTGNFGLVGGVILGLGIGYLLENEYVKYEPSELDVKQKIINLVIGLVLLFVVYFALEALKGVFDSVVYRYIRYAIVAFVVALILPMLFKKINKN